MCGLLSKGFLVLCSRWQDYSNSRTRGSSGEQQTSSSSSTDEGGGEGAEYVAGPVLILAQAIDSVGGLRVSLNI